MSKTYKRGDVFKLHPKSYDYLDNWCRHNIFIWDDERDKFVDTYWGILDSNSKKYDREKLDKLGELVNLNLNIFDMESAYERDFEEYESKDKLYIPMGGGSEKRLVRKGATKSKKLEIELLEHEISELESDIKWKQHSLENKREQLDLLTKKNLPTSDEDNKEEL